MMVRFNFSKLDGNKHGTQEAGQMWNRETVRGPRLSIVDLLDQIRQRCRNNPEGGKTRAIWYKRLIFYFPSGAWWYLDIALVRGLKA